MTDRTDQPAYGAPDAIRGFQGKYRWLSNFAPVRVSLDGESYPSVEHAYQAAKTLDPAERARIRGLDQPGQAKRAGRDVTMRPDWDAVKLDVMADLQRQKYAQEPYRSRLLATGEREIWEENGWGDRFWGVDARGKGRNEMGQLVQTVRREIAEAKRGPSRVDTARTPEAASPETASPEAAPMTAELDRARQAVEALRQDGPVIKAMIEQMRPD